MATQKKPYPKHRKQETNDAWRAQVKGALAARENPAERTIEWLAAKIEADAGGLRRLINKVGIPPGKRPQNTSSLKQAIDDALGIDPADPRDDEERIVLAAFRLMPPHKKKAVLAFFGL